MKNRITKQLSAYASVFGLGVLLVFTGCVKQHGDRVAGTTETYAIGDIGTAATDDHNRVVGTISPASTYFVQDDYVGCTDSDLAVGSLADNDRVVVSLSTGKKAACTKPSSLATMKERPRVTFFKSPGKTEYYIQTREVVRTSGRTESPNGVKVTGDVGIKLLDVVDYTTNSPILAQVRDKIELRALPGEKYKVYHKITPKVLYVMKVSTKDKLSHLDLPIADNLGNGEYAVPIAAVEIELSQYRNVKNPDGEITNVYEFNPVETLQEATHIKFKTKNLDEVDLPVEVAKDVYPADYFTKGQWYMNESVVDTRPGGEGFIGTSTGAFDSNFRGASRVQFTRTGSSLIACNVSIDERYAEDHECKESASVLTVPATGHSFKLEPTATEVEEIKILSSQAPFVKIEFEEHSTLKKTFEQTIFLGDGATLNNTSKDQLLEINFSKNKFSFVVQRGANGRRVMYSFLKTDGRTPYATKRHYKDDRQNKFGYFVQTVSKIRSSDTISREEDLEKDYLVQRHNPNKDIVFHFSNLTPNYKKGEDPYGLEIDYREIGRKSVEYWNKAYERAGAPNRVVLGEGDAPFGDIAYSTMNLIDSERGSNLLGVGPSLVDPYTGEVINANANVYIAPFREIIAGQVRNYIKAKTGLLDDPAKQLPRGATDNSTILGDMADVSLGIKDVLATVVPENIMTMVANFYHHGVASFTTAKINVDEYGNNGDEVTNLYGLTKFNSENSMVENLVKVAKRVPEMVFLKDQGEITFKPRSRKDLLKLQQALETHRPTFYRAYFMSDSGLASDYNTMTGQIEEQCGEVLKLVAFVNNRAEGEGAPARLTTAEELPALRHCMTQIIPDKFQATLIHEMGHNLGLRHNFYASADEKNFFNREEVKELYGLDIQEHDLPRSSSVMDYVRTEQDRLVYPGHYDIAAIRYGYANSVEVKSSATRPNSLAGKYVTLAKANDRDPAGSIIDEINGQGTLVPFAFCTDIEASLEIDPLCARHDFGTNPQMIVEDSINSFWESFTLYNFRYDRTGPGVTRPFRRAARLDKLKRVYTEWRVHLANYLGKSDTTGNVYLQRYDRAGYEALLTELRADPNFKGKEYLAVRDQIFDFIMDVAFFPNKYCLVSSEAGLKAYEFDKLRDELKNQLPKGTKISSCKDANMEALLASKGTFHFEAGLPVDNLWYSVNPQDTFEEDVNFRSFRAPLDVVGSFLDRYFASTFLGGRNAGYTGLLEKMFPNMMDEPDLYEKFEERMIKRMTLGVDLRDVMERANDVTLPPEEQVSLVLPNFDSESALLKALWLSLEQGIRNQFVDNSVKLSKYTRQFTTEPSIIEDAQANGGFAMPMTDGSTLVVRPEATVAFALAEALTGVVQTFQGVNQQIPTVEQLMGGLDDLALNVSEALKVEGGGQISIDQYLIFARNFNSVMESHPIRGAAVQQVYLSELVPYLVFLKGAEDDINRAVAAGQEPPAAAIEYVNNTVAQWTTKGMDTVIAETQAWLNQNGYGQITTVAPTSDSVVAKFAGLAPAVTAAVEQANQEQAQRQAYIDLHGDELFAQYELLRSVLTYDFSQVNTDFQIRLTELLGDRSGDSFAELSKNSRSDVRAFAQQHLNPKTIAKTQWGLKFPLDKLINARKRK